MVLEHAQQLGLCATGISPISSSNSVPPSASSKHPVRRSKAPVKAPFSWPKISLSIKRFWNGRAIDGDERPFPARTELVDGAGHQFFAGAAGTGDQYRRGAGSDQFDQPEDLLHLARSSPQLSQRSCIAQLAAGTFELGADSHAVAERSAASCASVACRSAW